MHCIIIYGQSMKQNKYSPAFITYLPLHADLRYPMIGCIPDTSQSGISGATAGTAIVNNSLGITKSAGRSVA